MVRCRACGNEIDFVTLTSGKRMPVEAAELETFYVHHNQSGHPQVILVLEGGEIIRGRLGTAHESGVLKVQARESHFSHCSGDPQKGVDDVDD